MRTLNLAYLMANCHENISIINLILICTVYDGSRADFYCENNTKSFHNPEIIKAEDSRYYDTVGLKGKYRYIQTIAIYIQCKLRYLVMAGVLK